MKEILQKLFAHKKLSREEAREILVNISNNQYNEAQIASFITVYLMRSISVEELQGFRDALLEMCVSVDLEGRETIDIVGTGGDGKNTFNISTLSSVVVAGAGYQVSKHGNYGVSSSCGSSNVLEYLGYKFTNDTDALRRQLDQADICFFHAPFFHPAMKTVAPIRRQLGVKTFFNMMGPLVNPAQPKYQMLGVYSLELGRLYQYIYQQHTDKEVSIIYAMDGYDEISLTGPVKLRTRHSEKVLTPEDLGQSTLHPSVLYGGETVAEAAKIFTDVLEGKGTPEQESVVLANAGVAISCLRPDLSIEACVDQARESLQSKRALQKLKILVSN